MAATAAVATVVTAAASVTQGYVNYTASQRAADASKKLADQQSAELAKEKSDRDAAAAKAATMGANFGFASSINAFSSGLGFDTGTGPKVNTGAGRSQLTGGL